MWLVFGFVVSVWCVGTVAMMMMLTDKRGILSYLRTRAWMRFVRRVRQARRDKAVGGGPYRQNTVLVQGVKSVDTEEDVVVRRKIGGHWERRANFNGDWGTWLPWERVDSCKREKLPLQWAVVMLMEFDRECEDHPMPCTICDQKPRTPDEEEALDREMAGWYIDMVPKLPRCESCGQRLSPYVVGVSNCAMLVSRR